MTQHKRKLPPEGPIKYDPDGMNRSIAARKLAHPTTELCEGLAEQRKAREVLDDRSAALDARAALKASSGNLKSGHRFGSTINLLRADGEATDAYALAGLMGLGTDDLETFVSKNGPDGQSLSYADFVNVVRTQSARPQSPFEFAKGALRDLDDATPVRKFALAMSLPAGENVAGETIAESNVGAHPVQYCLSGQRVKSVDSQHPLVEHLIGLATVRTDVSDLEEHLRTTATSTVRNNANLVGALAAKKQQLGIQ
ncbi:MAG: hypothetical protein ABH851_06870 [Methanobacteriota archaeon]